jgi:hypothetical protein
VGNRLETSCCTILICLRLWNGLVNARTSVSQSGIDYVGPMCQPCQTMATKQIPIVAYSPESFSDQIGCNMVIRRFNFSSFYTRQTFNVLNGS